MSNITVTYTFSNSTVASATEVNTNFTDIINGTSDGTKDFSINALTVAGAAVFNGTMAIGNASSDDLTITSSLASSVSIKTAATYDFGSATLALRSVYLGNASNFTVRLLASSSQSATYTVTWPVVQATATRQVFSNNGSGVMSWVALYNKSINAVASAAYVVLDTDGYDIISVTTGSSNRTVTLPTAADNSGRQITITKADSGTGLVVVDGEGSETIGSALTINLTSQYSSITIYCDGTLWVIKNRTGDLSGEGDLGTLTWDGTPPSGTVSKKYFWRYVAGVVHFWTRIEASVAGTTNTTVDFIVPSDVPVPIVWSTWGTSENGYIGVGNLGLVASTFTGTFAVLYKDGADVQTVRIRSASSSATWASSYLTYPAL